MNTLFRKTAVSMCVLSITALAGTLAQAQGEARFGQSGPLAQATESRESNPAGGPLPNGHVPCPKPYTLHVPATPGPVDTSALPPGHNYQGIGGNQINTWSGYTFKLPKPHHCCQAMSARLTVTFKALQGGAHGSPTSANDYWGVTKTGGGPVPGNTAALIYYPPLLLSQAVTTGYQVTKTFTVTDFSTLNSGGGLGVYAQDDTAIVSATLDITGCCLNIE